MSVAAVVPIAGPGAFLGSSAPQPLQGVDFGAVVETPLDGVGEEGEGQDSDSSDSDSESAISGAALVPPPQPQATQAPAMPAPPAHFAGALVQPLAPGGGVVVARDTLADDFGNIMDASFSQAANVAAQNRSCPLYPSYPAHDPTRFCTIGVPPYTYKNDQHEESSRL